MRELRRTPTPEDLQRFDAKWKVDEDGCHIWARATDEDGYGQFQFDGRPWKSHRWIFGVVHGFLPEQVMHYCDKPACVRISCLMPGDAAANNADRQRKGRSADRRGALCPSAKLSEDDVLEIRAESGRGVLTQRMLAEVYGVAQSQISSAVSGKQFSNV